MATPASGAPLPSCMWYYDDTSVEPGQTGEVTFVTHLQQGDYVRAMVFDLPEESIGICLDPAGRQITCR